MMVQEFNLTGTAKSPKQSVESLYLLRKRKKKQVQQSEEIPHYVEDYMKNMKTQTLEALTQDVKARNSFFQFVRHHQNAVFGEKFT